MLHKDPITADTPLARRILEAARDRIFRAGLRALTMDELAGDLGISKKTLYVHFPGKDAIAEKIVEFIGRTMRKRFDEILDNNNLTFSEKMCAISELIGNTLSKINPVMLRDLQRDMPALFQKIDELRQKNIPYVFGRLLREGQEEELVRSDIDLAFAAEFWLQAIRGLMHPETLERTQLSPKQTLNKAISIFLGGVLSPAGRKDYEKHLKQHPHAHPAF
ncbi:MAG: TetR/AcrR family transcriptional regulator [Nibricoccus sp.]